VRRALDVSRLYEAASLVQVGGGKAGQHILYLCGELCRLASCLPAQLMATATWV
jgi:hypothetical protein